jgi:hypothetical protein
VNQHSRVSQSRVIKPVGHYFVDSFAQRTHYLMM